MCTEAVDAIKALDKAGAKSFIYCESSPVHDPAVVCKFKTITEAHAFHQALIQCGEIARCMQAVEEADKAFSNCTEDPGDILKAISECNKRITAEMGAERPVEVFLMMKPVWQAIRQHFASLPECPLEAGLYFMGLLGIPCFVYSTLGELKEAAEKFTRKGRRVRIVTII